MEVSTILILRCFAKRSLEGRTAVDPVHHHHLPRYDSITRGSADT
jgi:hypothetical protein